MKTREKNSAFLQGNIYSAVCHCRVEGRQQPLAARRNLQVLSLASPVFCAMLQGEMLEGEQRRIEVQFRRADFAESAGRLVGYFSSYAA